MELAAETMDVLSIQLQPGTLTIHNQVIELDEITITRYASNRKMFQYLTIPSKHVLFVLTSGIINDCKWCGVDVTDNSLLILHPQQEHQALIPTVWESVEIMISDEAIINESILSELLWRQTLQPTKAMFNRLPAHISTLRQKLLNLFRSTKRLDALLNDKIAQNTLKDQIIDELRMILLKIETDGFQHQSMSQSRRYHYFSRAMAFIEANLEHPLTVQQICDQIGTTPRTLQLTFKELSGVSPYQYILSRKLHSIQQDLIKLQDDGIPIFHVAQKYGIQHAGRFSQHYKRLFTESPQATLKRRARL